MISHLAARPAICLITVSICALAVSALADPSPGFPHETPQHHRRHAGFQKREAEEEYNQRAYPLGHIPEGARARALAQIEQAKSFGPPPAPFGGYLWFSLGPAPMNSSMNNEFEAVSGRVSALAIDPSNPDHWLLGAAQGGIWETSNQGGTWLPRTDAQASLASGAIAFAPGNSSLVYAGTGEPNFSGDSYAGAGLLVSRDGGTTWQMLNSSFAETSFSGIKVDLFNSNNVSVTTVRGVAGLVTNAVQIPPTAPPRGVFVSTNGGTNFTRVLTGEATDLLTDPNNFIRQYAALGEVFGSPTNGVYRTTNGWASSQLINGPWTALAGNPTNIGRIAMAISPDITGTIYVCVSSNRNTGGLVGIWRTDDAWDPTPTWIQLPNPDTGPFLWYSLGLSVDPSDYTTVYLAELTVWKFSAGSGSWTDIGDSIHPDNHVMAWANQGFDIYRMLLGNDGGVWFSSEPISAAWFDLNSTGLSISQMYKGAVYPFPGSTLTLAGTQDNGTADYTGSTTWQAIIGGDGGDNAISASDPDNNWAGSFETLEDSVNIFRTQNGGTFLDNESFGIDPTDAPFFVHFEKSPRNDDLFIAGTIQLWLCTNFFSGTSATWSSNSPVMLDTNGAPVPLSAMAFSPSDATGLIYAFGTEDGQLRITTNGGVGWNNLDALNAVPNRFVTGLAFSPTNPDVLYVTLSGFDESIPGQPGHVFETTNARAASPSWTNVSPALDLPNDCIAIDPNNASSIFVGTDIGVWVTANGGSTWTHLGPEVGMPNVAVYDIRMNSISRATAFTHGRGAFTYAPGIPIVVVDGPVTPVDIACDDCPGFTWVNPGDLVSIDFPLINILPVSTVNLTASIMATSQITPVNGTQSYGALGQGISATRRFTFIAGGAVGGAGANISSCGDTVQVTLQLQDQGTSLGQVTVPFRLGVPSHPLSENFDEVPVPALPPGWNSSAVGVGVPWVDTTNTPPNVVSDSPDEDDVTDSPGNNFPSNTCAFSPAMAGSGQSYLVSVPFPVATSQAQLYFRQAFAVSNAFDGCILEIAIGSGPFQELLAAGGSFVQNGYNFTLQDRNPLGPRAAWSGNSGGWLPVLVNLPAAAAGQTVQLRWHFATSRGLPGGGWYVDAVAITEPLCPPPVSNPVILNPAEHGSQFTFAINTVSNRTYVIEYKTNLNDPSWQFLENLPGTGSQQPVSVPIDFTGQRFYRFHLQ